VTLRALVLALLLPSPLLAGTAILGPEQPATTPTYRVFGANDAPAVAASDGGFLAVWSNREGTFQPFSPSIVFAMPMNRSIPLSGAALRVGASSFRPGIAWTGSTLLLATRQQNQVTTRPLGADGKPLAETSAITGLPFANYDPTEQVGVAWNGAHALVATTGGAAVVNADGSFVRQTPLANSGKFSGLATTATLGLSLYIDNGALNVRFLDDAGNVSAPLPLAGEPVSAAAIATDGSRFLVVWTNTAGQLRGAFVESSGVPGAPFTIAGGADAAAPAAAWDGQRFLLTWGAGGTTLIAELAGQARPIHPGNGMTALAASNGAADIVWIDGGVVKERVAAFNDLPPLTISVIDSPQFNPRIIRAAGIEWLVLNDGFRLSVVLRPGGLPRVLNESAMVDFDVAPTPNGIAIASAQWNAGGASTSAVFQHVRADGIVDIDQRFFDGDQSSTAWNSAAATYLLAFRRGGQIFAVRFNALGQLIDSPSQLSAAGFRGAEQPRVAPLGDGFLVQWLEPAPALDGTMLKSATVDGAGRRSSERLAFTSGPGIQKRDLVAARGGAVLLWTTAFETHLARFDAAGAVERELLLPTPFGTTLFPTLLAGDDALTLYWIDVKLRTANRRAIAADLTAAGSPELLFDVPEEAVPARFTEDAITYTRRFIAGTAIDRAFYRRFAAGRRRGAK
jgi:hypothetical protein